MKRLVTIKLLPKLIRLKASHPCPFCEGKKVISEDGLHDGVYKLSVPCVSCYVSGINDEERKGIVDGIDVQTWLTGKVSDVVAESLRTEAVADIPIFNRIRELNKRDMMAVYHYLE
jgi:hypothetical protein